MHIIGNATIIILISYIMAGILTKRKLTVSNVISNLVVIILLYIILLR